jgi:DNA repair and recombination protein RAD54B
MSDRQSGRYESYISKAYLEYSFSLSYLSDTLIVIYLAMIQVVVSNFTSVLDEIERLCGCMNLADSLIRLDGSVRSDRRQALVDRFNARSDARAAIFLISAQAGGVGLNL